MDPNSILVVTREGVVLADLNRGSARLLVPGGRWPAWNPLYDMMAVSVVSDGPSQLRLVDFEGRTERVLYEAAAGVPPAIAPLVPGIRLSGWRWNEACEPNGSGCSPERHARGEHPDEEHGEEYRPNRRCEDGDPDRRD